MDVDIKPICDDNIAREIILKKKPFWMASYDSVGNEAIEEITLHDLRYYLP